MHPAALAYGKIGVEQTVASISSKQRMELYLVEALSLSLLFLLIIPLSIDDLSSTKVALLNFAAVVSHMEKQDASVHIVGWC
ncbi:hypothetical protein Tco_0485092 [Tanacetum coccineum]